MFLNSIQLSWCAQRTVRRAYRWTEKASNPWIAWTALHAVQHRSCSEISVIFNLGVTPKPGKYKTQRSSLDAWAKLSRIDWKGQLAAENSWSLRIISRMNQAVVFHHYERPECDHQATPAPGFSDALKFVPRCLFQEKKYKKPPKIATNQNKKPIPATQPCCGRGRCLLWKYFGGRKVFGYFP